MHGRLKIKTTAEQQEEKRKEREEKRKQYLKLFNYALQKYDFSTYEEFLKVSGQVLVVNPDLSTFWNHRRRLLLLCPKEKLPDLLMNEMELTKSSLMKNPKSYCAWHHRSWVMDHHPNPPWDSELKLCDEYLKKDERNFHCWDHRRYVVNGSGRKAEAELQFSKELIETNLSNYSAWHYRSKLLPVVRPPQLDTPHPIDEKTLVEELNMVVEAVFTDPSDQSPWFFLRWLINRTTESPKFLQAALTKCKDTSRLICVFTGEVDRNLMPHIFIGGQMITNTNWKAPSNHTYSSVWVTDLDFDCQSKNQLEMEFTDGQKIDFCTPINGNTCRKVGYGIDKNFSDLTIKTLKEIKENCLALDELEPNNKWVMLTLVDVLWALDYVDNKQSILNYLKQLEDHDPLRKNYYKDICSKLRIKIALREVMLNEENLEFRMNSQNLSHVYDSHLLSCFTKIDLRCNSITNIAPLRDLVNCKELDLSGNENISDFKYLCELPFLEILYVKNCNIKSKDELICLKNLGTLKKLYISGNPICFLEENVRAIRSELSNINEILS